MEKYGFNTDAMSKYKYKGPWFSLKNKEKTKSFKIVYRGILTICVPAYCVDFERKQIKFSRNHTFWVMLNYKWFKKLGLSSKSYKKNGCKLINMTANQLYYLIDKINYFLNLKNLYIYKDEYKKKWVIKKIDELAEKILGILKKYYNYLKIWDFYYTLKLFD